MEFPDPRLNQRRIAQVRYVGELYNYRMIDSNVIFNTLYSFISFGVAPDPLAAVSPLDPPENLIRLRLVTILLETCGCFFDRGSSKKKLDCFLQYFMRYWFWKKELYALHDQDFPLGMDHVGEDLNFYLVKNVNFRGQSPSAFKKMAKVSSAWKIINNFRIEETNFPCERYRRQ